MAGQMVGRTCVAMPKTAGNYSCNLGVLDAIVLLQPGKIPVAFTCEACLAVGAAENRVGQCQRPNIFPAPTANEVDFFSAAKLFSTLFGSWGCLALLPAEKRRAWENFHAAKRLYVR